MKRLLVTGSRDWGDRDAIDSALWHAWCDLGGPDGERMTLVHGACPTGADTIADECWSTGCAQPVERHPAGWSRGRQAGPERNAHMVALGADLCLAFIGDCSSPRCHREDRHPSHGASGCADMAEGAGIETRRFYSTAIRATNTNPAAVRSQITSDEESSE